MTDTILWDIRLPRLLYSILTGIGLSAVGLLMQTVTRKQHKQSLAGAKHLMALLQTSP